MCAINSTGLWHDVLAHFEAPPEEKRPATKMNIFAISGFPRRETVSSNVLAYYLDPNTPHGMDTLWLDALWAQMWNTAPSGIPIPPLPDPTDCTVRTEYVTEAGNRIDLLLEFEDTSIIIENKVNAALNNPLDDYVTEASKRVGCKHVYLVLLHASEGIMAPEYVCNLQRGVGIFDVTYDALFDRVLAKLGTVGMDADTRSLDVLYQFIDNYSPHRNEEKTMNHDKGIEQFLEQARGIEKQVINARDSYRLFVQSAVAKMNYLHEIVASDQVADVNGRAVKLIDQWSWQENKKDAALNIYQAFKYQVQGLQHDVILEFYMIDPRSAIDQNAPIEAIWIKAYRDKNPGERKTPSQEKRAIILPFWRRLGVNISDDESVILDAIRAERVRTLTEAVKELPLVDETNFDA